MKSGKSRSPDFNLKALNKATEEKGRVGAAWMNEDGSVSIVLDAFVNLAASPDLVLTLFPYSKSLTSEERD